jgi:hypothetical protein
MPRRIIRAPNLMGALANDSHRPLFKPIQDIGVVAVDASLAVD